MPPFVNAHTPFLLSSIFTLSNRCWQLLPQDLNAFLFLTKQASLPSFPILRDQSLQNPALSSPWGAASQSLQCPRHSGHTSSLQLEKSIVVVEALQSFPLGTQLAQFGLKPNRESTTPSLKVYSYHDTVNKNRQKCCSSNVLPHDCLFQDFSHRSSGGQHRQWRDLHRMSGLSPRARS